MACMIEPLAPGERTRLLMTLSPNGPDDYIEVRLTLVGNTEKIEFRQVRHGEAERSVFMTFKNFFREIRGIRQ
jgi:hypothetical protein